MRKILFFSIIILLLVSGCTKYANSKECSEHPEGESWFEPLEGKSTNTCKECTCINDRKECKITTYVYSKDVPKECPQEREDFEFSSELIEVQSTKESKIESINWRDENSVVVIILFSVNGSDEIVDGHYRISYSTDDPLLNKEMRLAPEIIPCEKDSSCVNYSSLYKLTFDFINLEKGNYEIKIGKSYNAP